MIRLLERSVARMVSAVLFFGLLLGGVLLRATDPVLGAGLMVASVLPLLHAVLSGFASGRVRR